MASASSAVQACSPEKDSPKNEHKKIRATLFFDGTLNNLVNTGIGMGRADDLEKHKKDVGTSYGNYFTNVALLFQNINSDKLNGYHKYIPLYIEGIGTTDQGSDSSMGYIFGTLTTGILTKVSKGIDEVLKQIRAFVTDKKNTTIDEIRFDVYGFSRGAAAARHFVNVVLNATYETVGDTVITIDPLKVQLEKEGYIVSAVKVYFVGIFDTVSSLGLDGTAMHMSNVNELGLDAISAATSVYHLAALDEHRKNFALTNIQSAGGKGKEIFLPGVHSDIGGSYNTREQENLQIYDTDVLYKTGAKYREIKADLDNLITGGWFNWTDVQHVKERRGMKSDEKIEDAVNWHGEVYVRRLGEDRLGIKNMYTRIPLRMMKDASKENVDFVTTIDTDSNTSLSPSLVDPIIAQAYNALKGGTIPPDWVPGSANMKKLRYSHLHFSARYNEAAFNTAPNAPRYEGGVRKRQIHNG